MCLIQPLGLGQDLYSPEQEKLNKHRLLIAQVMGEGRNGFLLGNGACLPPSVWSLLCPHSKKYSMFTSSVTLNIIMTIIAIKQKVSKHILEVKELRK